MMNSVHWMIIALGVLMGGYAVGTQGDFANIPPELMTIVQAMFAFIIGRQGIGMVASLKGKKSKVE